MNTKTKLSVPDIGGLLGKITDKQGKGELGTTDRQTVVPVSEIKQKNVETAQEEINSRLIEKTKKRLVVKTGRPTTKRDDLEYARIGASIPATLKKDAQTALTNKWLRNPDGSPIGTMEDLIAHALSVQLAPLEPKLKQLRAIESDV